MQRPTRERSIALTFLTLSLTMLLMIAGCASTGGIAPKSEPRAANALDVGAAIRAADASAQWPTADWWRVYGDPQLNRLIDEAQAGNPTLAEAAARVREAQSLGDVAHAALSPHLSGDLSVTRKHWPDNLYYGPGPLSNRNTWNNTASLGLSFPLDLWGRDENAAKRALDAAQQRAADARAARLTLEVNVVRAYVDLSKQYALRDIAVDLLARQRELAQLAQRRLTGGIGTQLELSQAQSPLPEYERQIEALDEAIALDRNQLAALLGAGPGAGDALTRPALALDVPIGLPSTVPADLIGHRPDVVAARWAVAGAARGIDVAHAAFYPNIDLIASLGAYAAAGPLFQFLHAANGGWSAGPAVSLPIFDAGALRGRYGAANAQYDEAVERYNGTVIGALKEIADALVRSRSLAAQEGDAQRSAAAAERSYRLSTVGFRRGLADYVNVVVSETQWLSARERVAQIQAARLAAHAALMGALGGGLAAPGDGPNDAAMAPSATHRAAR